MFFVFKQKSAYELRISDWSSDLCSSDLFESIGANPPSAVDGIKAMIIGSNTPGFGHRKHLLGMDEWNASLQDIGIGDRKSVVEGKSVYVRVDLGGRSIIKKEKSVSYDMSLDY